MPWTSRQPRRDAGDRFDACSVPQLFTIAFAARCRLRLHAKRSTARTESRGSRQRSARRRRSSERSSISRTSLTCRRADEAARDVRLAPYESSSLLRPDRCGGGGGRHLASNQGVPMNHSSWIVGRRWSALRRCSHLARCSSSRQTVPAQSPALDAASGPAPPAPPPQPQPRLHRSGRPRVLADHMETASYPALESDAASSPICAKLGRIRVGVDENTCGLVSP